MGFAQMTVCLLCLALAFSWVAAEPDEKARVERGEGVPFYHERLDCRDEGPWADFREVVKESQLGIFEGGSGEELSAALSKVLQERTANLTEVLQCTVGVIAGFHLLARRYAALLDYAKAYRLLQLALVYIFLLRNALRVPEDVAHEWGVHTSHVVRGIRAMRAQVTPSPDADVATDSSEQSVVSSGISSTFRDPTLRIAVVSVCAYPEDHPIELNKLTPDNRKAYAEKHGYDLKLHLFHPMPNQGIHIQHSKLYLMAHYLRSGLYDWVTWLDCDSIIMNLNRTLDSIVYRYAGLRKDVSAPQAARRPESGAPTHAVSFRDLHTKVPGARETLEAYATHAGSCNTAEGCIVAVEVRVNPEVRYTLRVSTAQIDMADDSERIAQISVDDQDVGGCNPSPDSDHDCGFADCFEKQIPETLTADGFVVLRAHAVRTHNDCHCDPLTHECYNLFFPLEQVLESDGAVVDPKYGMYVRFKLIPREMPYRTRGAPTGERSPSSEDLLRLSPKRWESKVAEIGIVDATYKPTAEILDQLAELPTTDDVEGQLAKVGCSCTPTCPTLPFPFWGERWFAKSGTGAQLRRVGAECDGPDVIFSFNASLEECANLCRATEGCSFVAYGTGLKRGRCLWEMNDCLTFERDHYLIYDIGDAETMADDNDASTLECTVACAKAHCSSSPKPRHRRSREQEKQAQSIDAAVEGSATSRSNASVTEEDQDKALYGTSINSTSAVASQMGCTCGQVCPKQPPWVRQEPRPVKKPMAHLRRLNSECTGSDLLFDLNATLLQCTELCRAVEGCHFFALGTGLKKGRCMWETSDCIAFETDSYHVYDIGDVEEYTSPQMRLSEEQTACAMVCDRTHCQKYDGFQIGLRRYAKPAAEATASDETLPTSASSTQAALPASTIRSSSPSRQVPKYTTTIGCSCTNSCPRMRSWSHKPLPSQQHYSLRRRNSECEGPDVVLSLNAALPRCAALCRATEGCRFFSHGKGPKRGRCLWEFSDCLSFETDSYDVYDAHVWQTDDGFTGAAAPEDGCTGSCDRAHCVEGSALGIYGAPLEVDDGAVDLLITEEGWGLSSANWMIRRSTWSINFLEEAFLVAHQAMPLFGDQDAMIYLLTNDRAIDPNLAGDALDPHAKIIAQRELNAYDALNAHHMRCDAFQDGDLLVTFPGCKDPVSCNPLFREAISHSQGIRPGSEPTWPQIRLYGPPRLAAQLYEQYSGVI